MSRRDAYGRFRLSRTAALARHIAVYAEPTVRGSFPDTFDEKSGDIQFTNQQKLVVIAYVLNF